jgi:hypothetical protein
VGGRLRYGTSLFHDLATHVRNHGKIGIGRSEISESRVAHARDGGWLRSSLTWYYISSSIQSAGDVILRTNASIRSKVAYHFPHLKIITNASSHYIAHPSPF